MEIIWKQPKAKEEIKASLQSAVKSAKRGDCIIYYQGRSGKCPDDVLNGAYAVGISDGCALVQRPHGPSTDDNRIWSYMVQKQ